MWQRGGSGGGEDGDGGEDREGSVDINDMRFRI